MASMAKTERAELNTYKKKWGYTKYLGIKK